MKKFLLFIIFSLIAAPGFAILRAKTIKTNYAPKTAEKASAIIAAELSKTDYVKIKQALGVVEKPVDPKKEIIK